LGLWIRVVARVRWNCSRLWGSHCRSLLESTLPLWKPLLLWLLWLVHNEIPPPLPQLFST
jgi:hypothetical protein